MSIKLLTGIDFTDDKSVLKAATSLATRRTDASVNEYVACLAFSIGRAAKERSANECPSFNEAFAAFAKVHYGPTSGRKLTEKSAKAYAGAYGAYTLAGFHPGYDAIAVANFVMDKAKGAFTARGAALREILKAYPTVSPTDAQAEAMLPSSEVKTVRGYAETQAKQAAKLFGNGGEFVTALASNPQLDVAVADYRAALQAILKYAPLEIGDDEDLAAVAAKKRAALTAE